MQFKCDANDRKAQINGQWNAESLLSQDYDTSTLGNVLSVIFELDFEIDGNRYTDRVELDYQYNEAHVTFGMNGEKSRFKIVSMTPSQAKTPDKTTKWHALAELRLDKFETAAEEKAAVITAQKEPDNRNNTTILNKVDGDGLYAHHKSCTSGPITGRCISRSDFDNLCRKVGTGAWHAVNPNPYSEAAYFGNNKQFARIWAARNFAGISGGRTQLRNNKCIFAFSYDGLFNGTQYSGRLACELNQIKVEAGKPFAAGVNGFSCVRR